MKNARVFNVLSLIFNLVIVGAVTYVTVAILLPQIMNEIIYFTVISNLLVALAALICIPCNIVGIAKRTPLPKAAYAFKLFTTACVTVTLTVAAGLLPLTTGMSIAELFGNFSFESEYFFLHLVVPALSILSFVIFDHTYKAKWTMCFLAMIPVALYGAFYLTNYYMKFVGVGDPAIYDWYGLTKLGGDVVAFAMFGGILVGAFVIALVLYLLNRLISKGLFKSEPAAAEKAAPVEEEKAEEEPAPAPVAEEPAPAEDEEPAKEDEVLEEPQQESESEEPEEPVEEEKKPAKAIYVRRAEPAAPSKKPEEQKQEAAPAKKPVPAKPAPAPVKPAPVPVKEEKKAAPAPVKKPAEKPVEEKPAPAKKPAEKQAAKAEPAKKAAPAKKPAEKPAAPAKEEAPAQQTKVYHLTKRKEDGMWAITFVGGQKAVKLFKTKKEAEAALKVLTENQGATALIRNSKGAKAGKFASSIKAPEDEKK